MRSALEDLSDVPLVVEQLFGGGEVGLGRDDILIKRIISLISDDLLLNTLGEFPGVIQLLLSNLQGVEVSNDIVISAEVWHEVVLLEVVDLWVQVLGAASGVADWVGVQGDGLGARGQDGSDQGFEHICIIKYLL